LLSIASWLTGTTQRVQTERTLDVLCRAAGRGSTATMAKIVPNRNDAMLRAWADTARAKHSPPVGI